MTALCQSLNCLPHAGGILDQDSYIVELMKAVILAQREKERMEANKSNSGG